MKVNKELVRNCLTCEHYAKGCEAKCPFELEGVDVSPQGLQEHRKNMEKEKKKAYKKAMQELNSAENKAVQEIRYKKPKGDRKQEVEEAATDRKQAHKEMMNGEYPKDVFKARVSAIKQAERRLKRIEKEQAKK